MNKEIIFNEEVLLQLNEGAKAISNAVKPTLGPKGRFVVIEQPNNHPLITKDGATVAKNISLENRFENMGAELMKEVSIKTENLAGDGTTTSIVLAQTILQEGIKYVVSGIELKDILNGLRGGVEAVVANLKNQSLPVTTQRQLEQIAITSANNDKELGKTIAAAFHNDKNIMIQVEEGKNVTQELVVSKGIQLMYGNASRYYGAEDRTEVVLEHCYILITDISINSIPAILPLLTKIADEKKPLLIICPSISDELLTFFITNRKNSALDAVIIKIADPLALQNELLPDLAILTKAKFISNEKGDKLETISLSHLGMIKKAIITHDKTVITLNKVKNNEAAYLLTALKDKIATNENNREKERISERIQRLKGSAATLYIGGVTQTELIEKKYRAEDAVRAVEAAIDEGIVPGGGTAFIHSIKILNLKNYLYRGERAGLEILKKALKIPFQTLLSNSGKEPNPVIEELLTLPHNYGYNLNTDTVEDMYKAGIIDPVKVLRLQLELSFSVVAQMLATRCAIADKNDVWAEKNITNQ